ncbi:hypothetical protein AMJ47_00990 [Parcubacteria bacterium DG_72]|nr:MAG: hypothetical protein AMJ47_00990 [Parcubacteria bacterium DG_72]
MKNYELVYLISPDLAAAEAKALSEKIAGFISELEGIVLNNADPERRNLAYSIKKKLEASLVSLEFSLLPEKIKNLKEKIISEKQILRHIIVTKTKEGKIRKPADRQPAKKEEGVIIKEKEKKVEIEKINEKIDEILK